MLSYRHGFHAGHWADVHKHAALTLLLRHLAEKDTPFCVVDPFAGDGVYDLTSAEAQKTGEFRSGIERIWRRTDAPPGVADYLASVRAMNGGALTAYPGSPALARTALRGSDALILGELHPTAYAGLRRWAAGDPRIHVHRRDGFELMGALLPPPVRRGLALVDPAYEVKADYETLPAALMRALERWPTGICMVWYPVLAEGRHAAMVAALGRLPARAVLQAEIAPPRSPATGLRVSGLVVINPPWRFDAEVMAAGNWLAGALWRPAGRSTVRWLRRDAPAAKSI
jgi:23S rRNA (adenine2030-N6)-methyltransferase